MSTHSDFVKVALSPAASILFRQRVGAFMWVGRITHPDILQPVVYRAQLWNSMASTTFWRPSVYWSTHALWRTGTSPSGATMTLLCLQKRRVDNVLGLWLGYGFQLIENRIPAMWRTWMMILLVGTYTSNILFLPLPLRLIMLLCMMRARTDFPCTPSWDYLCKCSCHSQYALTIRVHRLWYLIWSPNNDPSVLTWGATRYETTLQKVCSS